MRAERVSDMPIWWSEYFSYLSPCEYPSSPHNYPTLYDIHFIQWCPQRKNNFQRGEAPHLHCQHHLRGLHCERNIPLVHRSAYFVHARVVLSRLRKLTSASSLLWSLNWFEIYVSLIIQLKCALKILVQMIQSISNAETVWKWWPSNFDIHYPAPLFYSFPCPSLHCYTYAGCKARKYPLKKYTIFVSITWTMKSSGELWNIGTFCTQDSLVCTRTSSLGTRMDSVNVVFITFRACMMN